MKILDLFSGMGGFSQAFKDRGHRVVTVDIIPDFHPELCTDIMDYEPGEYFDVVLASPPCIEFSKSALPMSWAGNKVPPNPDTKLVKRAFEIIQMVMPRYWVIENVRGAVPFFKPILGKPVKKIGSRYLWGVFPIFDCKPLYGKEKIGPCENRPSIRSMIPYELSNALCYAMEG